MQATMPSRQACVEAASVSTVNLSRIAGVSPVAGLRETACGGRPRSNPPAILVPPISTPMTVRSGLMTTRSLPWCRLATRGNALPGT